MRFTTDESFWSRFATAVPLIMGIVVWQIIAYTLPSTRFFFSSPDKVLMAFWDLTISGDLFVHTTITVFEALAGFAIGTSFGTLMGLSLWYSPFIARVAKPYVIAIGAIPIFALAPVMIAWFGIGIFAKVMVAALSTVVVATVQAYEGSMTADSRYLRLIQVLGGTRSQAFWKVVVPSAVIWVVNSMKLNVGLALMGAFIGEFISSNQGLGYLIMRAAGLFDMATVFAACIVLMAVALLFSWIIGAAEHHLFRWRSAPG